MIYYYRPIKQQVPQIRITSDSMELLIKVGLWFPNTKAKVKQLLDLMAEYNTGNMEDILKKLIETLEDKSTFELNFNKDQKMFKKMLTRNINMLKDYYMFM